MKNELKTQKTWSMIESFLIKAEQRKKRYKIFIMWHVSSRKNMLKRKIISNALNIINQIHKRIAYHGLKALILNRESEKFVEYTQKTFVKKIILKK